MNIDRNELTTILAQFNPWWADGKTLDIPEWRRAAFQELFDWVYSPPAARAILLLGARQVGKTTLLRQTIARLITEGVSPSNILYATFDHPLINLAGIDEVLKIWREREPKTEGIEYVFLDEAQFIKGWETWLKHQVDFNKERRIVFTGSAMPLVGKQESGVGRWHSIHLTTFSFYEYYKLQSYLPEPSWFLYKFIREQPREKLSGKYIMRNLLRLKSNSKLPFSVSGFTDPKLPQLLESDDWKQMEAERFPELPVLKSLRDLFDWREQDFARIATLAAPWLGHFHDYLMRGGFPQTIQIININQAQSLLREDIVDKILKRDMTAIFGVRRVLDLERFFLYLCLHEGGLLDLNNCSKELGGITRPTTERFVELLEAANLIYRLSPFGYGKEVLRAKYKVYLADSAIASAVLLRSKGLLDDVVKLGFAVEAAVFKHLLSLGYRHGIRFSYWRGSKEKEVDIVAEVGEKIVPFEVKYWTQKICDKDIKGLIELCNTKPVEYAYVITKSLDDFGLLKTKKAPNTHIMRLPAALFCYWLGHVETLQDNLLK